MATARPRYKLRLDKLDFCSIVDNPAQPNAKTLLIKRAPAGDGISGPARLMKLDDELGLAFFWAFTSTNPDGTPHHDLQGDAIDQATVMKAAMEFMLAGGNSDEMHDGQPGAGRVVFAMPWDPEVASAYGETCKSSGLMIVVKPRPDVMAKLKDGTYNGVSIAGMGTRETVKREAIFAAPVFERAVTKAMVATSVVDGHAHIVDLDDPATERWSSLQTSYQNADGAECGHSHGWTFDASGAIAIAPDSGHTHSVADVVPPQTVTAAAALEAAEQARITAIPAELVDDPSDGIPITVADEESSGKTVNVIIAARAPQPTRPAAHAAPSVKSIPKETAMPPEPITVTKTIAVALSEAQFTFFKSLGTTERDAFLAKSDAERIAIVEPIEKARLAAEALANEVVYTSLLDGSVFRKSDDQRIVAYAKAADVAAAAAQTATFEKRAAAELGHLPGTTVVKAAGLRSAETITDEPTRKAWLESLRAIDAFAKELGKPKGSDGGGDGTGDNTSAGDPWDVYKAAETKFVTAFVAKNANAKPGVAEDAFLASPDGKAAKAAYDATRAYGKQK